MWFVSKISPVDGISQSALRCTEFTEQKVKCLIYLTDKPEISTNFHHEGTDSGEEIP